MYNVLNSELELKLLKIVFVYEDVCFIYMFYWENFLLKTT